MTGNNRDYCKNATSPINISMSGIMGPCVLKCDYNYDYGTYSPNITNSRSYLSLNYSGKTNPVKYNDEQFAGFFPVAARTQADARAALNAGDRGGHPSGHPSG